MDNSGEKSTQAMTADSETSTGEPFRRKFDLRRIKVNGISTWLANTWKKIAWLTLLEVALITSWAVWVGRGYLDFSQFTWPQGDAIPVTIQSHFVWTLLTKCGACMLWNGFINGGSPAFAELMGSVLHPLTIITTVIFGVRNSIKLLLVASLIMAGLANGGSLKSWD